MTPTADTQSCGLRRYPPRVGSLRERVWSRIQRDRDDFRAESQDVGWGAWFFGAAVMWAVGLALMAALAAIGRPMWGLITVLISVTGGLGLARTYHRHRGHRSEKP